MPIWRAAAFFVWLAVGPASANANLRTLRTFHSGACDGDSLELECFSNTIISVTKVQYSQPKKDALLCLADKDKEHVPNWPSSTACTISQPISVVEDICRDKSQCSVKVLPEILHGDPCPGVDKYAEVFYKCRPNSSDYMIACENDILKLRCRKTLKIVIYNAWYGSTLDGTPECPLMRKHKLENCEAEYATETVVNICHGRSKCVIAVNSTTFGKTGCSKRAQLFLKVVYTCVPKDILQDLDMDLGSSSSDYLTYFEEPQITAITHEHRERDGNILQNSTLTYHPEDFLNFGGTTTKGVDVLSDENANDISTDVNCTAESDRKVVGFITEWIAAYKFIRDNKEKFILYVTVSLGAGLLAFLVVLAARLYMQQRRQLKVAKLNISEPLPLTVDEDCSDVDNYDPRHNYDRSIEVVRYTNTSTVMRQDSNNGPRAPLSHSMNNYYYN